MWVWDPSECFTGSCRMSPAASRASTVRSETSQSTDGTDAKRPLPAREMNPFRSNAANAFCAAGLLSMDPPEVRVSDPGLFSGFFWTVYSPVRLSWAPPRASTVGMPAGVRAGRAQPHRLSGDCLSMTTTLAPSRPFTPLTADGKSRLEFDKDSIEIVAGSPFGSGRGVLGKIRVDGHVYEVRGAPCGLNCYCDATINEVSA